MREILDKRYMPPQFEAPFLMSHPGWNHELIPCVRLTWESCGPGLSTPGPDSAFDIEQWARYILYHGRPGCPNPFVGVAFNYAFHVHYHNVFGHLLCRALAPTSSVAWAIFTCHFACLTAVPRWSWQAQGWTRIYYQTRAVQTGSDAHKVAEAKQEDVLCLHTHVYIYEIT
jgi:hypothetical protein